MKADGSRRYRGVSKAARRAIAATLFTLLGACGRDVRQRDIGPNIMAIERSKISHVIVIIQENRSFDNLFHGYPGADSASSGSTHDGSRVMLQPVSLKAPYDLSHSVADYLRDFDHGKMDGFDLEKTASVPNSKLNLKYPAYGFVPHDEIRPYLTIADRFVLADKMFQSNFDQSFAAHLYLIASQAGHTMDVPSGRPWGCDAQPRTRVRTLRGDGKDGLAIFPCFTFKTLGDELDSKGLSWGYYAPKVDSATKWLRFMRENKRHFQQPIKPNPDFGQLWSAYDAVAQIRYGPDWSANVISPETSILRDARQNRLGNVTWIVPSYQDSDHSLSESDAGPDWVASVINEIGESAIWKNSVIFVTWDDSGGWYDHVAPPRLDYDGLGNRVPLLVVSPYAKSGYVSHETYEFGSINKFIEDLFGMSALGESDRRANSLSDCFEFSQPPRAFEHIPIGRSVDTFANEARSNSAPDDD